VHLGFECFSVDATVVGFFAHLAASKR
jgi:hypothetical protein